MNRPLMKCFGFAAEEQKYENLELRGSFVNLPYNDFLTVRQDFFGNEHFIDLNRC